jgi:hypothetical protein
MVRAGLHNLSEDNLPAIFGVQMFRNLKSLAAVPALLASALLITPEMANAATVTAGAGGFDDGWATAITYESDPSNTLRPDPRNDRRNPLNALGENDGKFFSIGLGSQVDLTFGTLFDTSTTVWEVTFNPNTIDEYPETADVFVGMSGDEGSFVLAGNILNADSQSGFSLSLTGLGGPFDTVRIVDTTKSTHPNSPSKDGWDLDGVRVTPVPLPAAAWLFGSALVGVGIIGRRKKRQAADAAA